MIAPSLLFDYRFTLHVSDAGERHWSGHGSARSTYRNVDGLAGPRPRCEVRAGWLTLFPTDGWSHSFSSREFSDQPRLHGMDDDARLAEIKRVSEEGRAIELESLKEVQQSMPFPPRRIIDRFWPFSRWRSVRYQRWTNERDAVRTRLCRERGLTRDLASYSLFVGDSLSAALRAGDVLTYSRDGNGDYRYGLERGSEVVLRAGTVGVRDTGEPVAIWQEPELDRSPQTAGVKQRSSWAGFADSRSGHVLDETKSALHLPYVTARIKTQRFELHDGEEALLEPFYVFLARSNRNVPAFAFEFWPRAVHAAGRLDVLTKEQIIDAAQALTNRRVRML